MGSLHSQTQFYLGCERRGGAAEFLTTLCALYSYINALLILNSYGKGGRGDKLAVGVRGNPRATPLMKPRTICRLNFTH